MAFEGGISRRQIVSGALGVGAASALGVTIARAQSATPSTSTSGKTARGATVQQRYTDFVDKLAANLGNTDASKVDTAIRTTLKQMVDEEVQAGNLSANEATALKNRIDSGDFPADLPFGFGGRMRRNRMERGGNSKNKNNKGNKPANNNATPAATPSTT